MADVLVIKSIKPKRLQPKAIRFEVLNALRKEGRIHQKELKKTVRTWSPPRPKFESAISLAGGDLTVITAPTGHRDAVDRWNWIDEGTRSRPIHVRRAPYLVFKPGYQARTRPKHFGSGASRRYGTYVRVKSVRAHRIRPRYWTKTLSKTRKRPFMRSMFSAVERGSRKLYK